MTHKCPIDGCRTRLPQNALLCARHWAMLPLWLQGAVHELWNHGTPGVAYLSVRQEAMEHITRIDRAMKEAAPPLPVQRGAVQCE